MRSSARFPWAPSLGTLARRRGNDHMQCMAIIIRTSLEEPQSPAQFVPHRPARPTKEEGGRPFTIVSEYQPSGDQPQAIAELVDQVQADERTQVLLGVTGSGKTF